MKKLREQDNNHSMAKNYYNHENLVMEKRIIFIIIRDLDDFLI